MPIPNNINLYNQAKQEADKIYKKSSGFKSMFIQKRYKALGGTFTDDNKERKLSRWIKEKWYDFGNKSYPVYRPSIRISKQTPLTINEIDKSNLKKQIKLKQKFKGNKNLPPFKKK